MKHQSTLIYIGRSRLHRNRANLIQTLHSAAAFRGIGITTRLYLPPWHHHQHLNERLQEFGIQGDLDVRASQFLHSRWGRNGYRLFIWTHRSSLHQADIVYTRSPEISTALSSAGIIHQLEIHDVENLKKKQLLNDIIKQHHAGLINRLLPISSSAADLLIDAGAVADRMCVSPSGVDSAAYADISPFAPRKLDHPRIFYIGRISESRGLSIFSALSDSGVADITLVGDQENKARNSSSLRVMPFVPHREIPTIYDQTDLVLLPYQNTLEHIKSISPLKLFEALAAGRPIIASDIPPIREIIEHGKTGLLVKPDDIDAWIDAIKTLQVDREFAVKLARSARALASGFSWEQRACRIVKAIGLEMASLDG